MTAAGQEPAGGRGRTRPQHAEATAANRRGAVAVAAIVMAAFVGYGALSLFVDGPRVFGDEVIYFDAADSLADGHGLHVEGARYGRGPGYPAAIAPVLTLTQDRSLAYVLIKLVNALCFALAAVPAYLIARRLLSFRASIAVSALSVALPSSVYVGLVMTDSLAYLVGLAALYIILLAVERPTTGRQVATAGAITAAYLVRPQFVVLFPAYLAALAVARVLTSSQGERRVRDLWPTAAVAIAIVMGAAVLLAFRGVGSTLGDYAFLWRAYSAGSVLRWFDYHLADLALYVGVVPLALAPAIVVALRRAGQRGSNVHAAFLAVFVSASFFALLAAAAFASTVQDRVYDRYFFYVIPLWLVAGAAWLQAGAVRTWRTLAVGGAFLIAVFVPFRFDTYVVNDASKELHATATPVWAHLGSWAVAHGQTGHRAVAVVAAVALVVAAAVSRRRSWLLAAPVVAVFLANASFLWHNAVTDTDTNVFAVGTNDDWIDRAVPPNASVAMLYVNSPRCDPRIGYSYVLTQFFNDRVTSVRRLGAPPYGDLPSSDVNVGRGGRLVTARGKPLSARWIVTPRGVPVDGTPTAIGTRDDLVLWHVDGRVDVRVGSDGHLKRDACRSRSA